jgi:hypothetical protein
MPAKNKFKKSLRCLNSVIQYTHQQQATKEIAMFIKAAIMKQAHAIARGVAATGVAYRSALSIGAKQAWLAAKASVNGKITVASKDSGKSIDLYINNTSTDVIAKIAGIDCVIGVCITSTGIKSRFPVFIGGNSVNVKANFSDIDMFAVQAIFSELQSRYAARRVVNMDYEHHHAAVLKMMSK